MLQILGPVEKPEWGSFSDWLKKKKSSYDGPRSSILRHDTRDCWPSWQTGVVLSVPPLPNLHAR